MAPFSIILVGEFCVTIYNHLLIYKIFRQIGTYSGIISFRICPGKAIRTILASSPQMVRIVSIFGRERPDIPAVL